MEGSRRGKRPACVASPSSPPPPQTPPSTEEDEEEKIEKFYALLGNIRAMRDLWRTNATNKRPRKEETLWRPTFVREDFINPDGAAAGSPEGGLVASKEGERKKGKEKEARGEDESGLDLSLAL